MKNKFLLVALVMVASLIFIAACGRNGDDDTEAGTNQTPTPTPVANQGDAETPEVTDGESRWDDLIQISVSVWDASASFAGEPCEIYLYIQERFGLTFEPLDIGWDNMGELPLLWAAADTLPDILGGVDIGAAIWMEWRDSGLIRSLPGELERWPSLNEWMSQPFMQERMVDGEHYIVPRGTVPQAEITALARGIINRRDWREQLGIPIPTTEEDFLNMWQAYVDNAADLPGAADVVFGVLPGGVFNLSSHTFTGHGHTGGDWAPMGEGGSFVRPAFEYSSLPLMAFWREAFQRGLLDPDFVTNSVWQGNQQFALGRAGTLLRQVVPIHLNNIYLEWVELNPDIDFVEAVEILFPPYVPDREHVWLIGGGFWSESFISSNVDDATMERIMYFIDWKKSADGINTMIFGFEGRDWQWQDGEVVMLTDINPETGRPFAARDLYQYAAGGMTDLIIWSGDAVEWFDPNIPAGIRQMAIEFRDRVITPDATYIFRDNRVSALHIPEMVELGVPLVNDEWVAFVTDTSALSHEELWHQFRARWEAHNLLRAYEIMTETVRARGYID
ncbi:MAG: hypothetical protein FWE11_09945 [Defluviitaleaceae bacterium]|nr:hypothetical protein [Defluviitaleaceae bacterium]